MLDLAGRHDLHLDLVRERRHGDALPVTGQRQGGGLPATLARSARNGSTSVCAGTGPSPERRTRQPVAVSSTSSESDDRADQKAAKSATEPIQTSCGARASRLSSA